MSRPLVTSRVQKVPIYQPSRSMEELRRTLGIAEIIKLGSNESPFGPSPLALEAMRHVLAETHRYPDGYALCQQLAQTLCVQPEQVVLGAGSTDLIELCIRTFATTEGHAVFSAGSFVAYRLFLLAASVPFTETPLADWEIDLDAMAGATRPDTQLIFLANPNNPTGSRFGATALERLIGRIHDDVVLVLDDAYADYIDPRDAPDAPDTLAVLRRRPRTVVLRTFSKAHGLAGLRVGYAVTSGELASAMRRLHRPFPVDRVGLAGAQAALGDQDHLARTREANRNGRAQLLEGMRALGLEVLPSHANFVTAALPSQERAAELTRALWERGIIVRHLDSFGLPRCVRVTVGTEEENAKLLSQLGALVRAEDRGG